MNKIERAERFAKIKHRGQTRKDGKTPYWKHLQQVVKNLKILGIRNQDMLCVGWLHDTIEDTNTDYDDLKEKFGSRVAKSVSQVTKDKRLERKERELQYIRQLRNASHDSKIVKLCDIIANIEDLENSGYSRQKISRQIDDKLRYFSAIKSGIFSNKTKPSGLEKSIERLNLQLSKYGKAPIEF